MELEAENWRLCSTTLVRGVSGELEDENWRLSSTTLVQAPSSIHPPTHRYTLTNKRIHTNTHKHVDTEALTPYICLACLFPTLTLPHFTPAASIFRSCSHVGLSGPIIWFFTPLECWGGVEGCGRENRCLFGVTGPSPAKRCSRAIGLSDLPEFGVKNMGFPKTHMRRNQAVKNVFLNLHNA